MSNDLVKHVETLIIKAAQAEKSDDALKFSQAACNAANAIHTVHDMLDWGPGSRSE